LGYISQSWAFDISLGIFQGGVWLNLRLTSCPRYAKLKNTQENLEGFRLTEVAVDVALLPQW
jgi:hypothetical protein